ncbi:MAG: type II CRISPR-associated endonuclease Cas1 [Actinobacteria bacterium]|nr:type II CRISPR-associated endonuclease Cas1 [Actinomycetota bacterium]
MIKRTLYFGNATYLRKKDDQLIISVPESKGENSVLEKSDNEKYEKRTNQNSVPLEDIGIVILDHPQITITHGVISALLENNAAIITCDSSHLPVGLVLNLSGNQLQSEKFQFQIEASLPLRKQLWQQTITAKIRNQAGLLKMRGKPFRNMLLWASKVRSGDPNNLEARAAAYYWKNVFREDLNFFRDREGLPPNNLLNYGYAILRAIVARSLVSSGLLSTLGIHHHNRYNAYCLADDVMEPFRPYVDDVVATIIDNGEDFEELYSSTKRQLLEIATKEIIIEGKKSPLMVGVHRTTSSLAKCYAGEMRKILYPEIL